jgi:hypothetical protein
MAQYASISLLVYPSCQNCPPQGIFCFLPLKMLVLLGPFLECCYSLLVPLCSFVLVCLLRQVLAVTEETTHGGSTENHIPAKVAHVHCPYLLLSARPTLDFCLDLLQTRV